MERRILELIAEDRIEIPLSSMRNKLQKAKKKDAAAIAEELKVPFKGERVFARVKYEDRSRARGTKEAIAEFCEEFPKYGIILKGKIEEKRVISEKHLYFGVNEGCRITGDDYMTVMESLGLAPATARALYPDLMEISRKLERARDEKRSIIVGKYSEE